MRFSLLSHLLMIISEVLVVYAMLLPLPNIGLSLHPGQWHYPLGQKGYKLLDLATRKVFTSRDVYFFNNISLLLL